VKSKKVNMPGDRRKVVKLRERGVKEQITEKQLKQDAQVNERV
jgi:hypothetical protein